MTRSRLASRTPAWPLMTRDTVMGDTPACAATSSIVMAPPFRRTVLLVFFTQLLPFDSMAEPPNVMPITCALQTAGVTFNDCSAHVWRFNSRQSVRFAALHGDKQEHR